MSTGIGVGACCLSGHLHQGTPKGRVETIGGIQTYVSEPEGDSKAMSVVFISDSTSDAKTGALHFFSSALAFVHVIRLLCLRVQL